ncbi:hypothetical protein ACH5RR_008358 [Cinchona calisaya]|uniref:Plastocyanin-like domain-containing protein n=1 Tax=Cinchona calisaya TaxID=153742 RepID=A0ABD3AB56_9GENT
MEPGNETGYIVRMSTCYPQPVSFKISTGESLTLVSNYSNAQMHTGVMGLFYILVADQPAQNANSAPHASVDVRSHASYRTYPLRIRKQATLLCLGGNSVSSCLVLAPVITYPRRCRKAAGYESIAAGAWFTNLHT